VTVGPNLFAAMPEAGAEMLARQAVLVRVPREF
jgi:hypothetical protein